MTLVQIILLALQLSVAFIVVSVALRAVPRDLTYLLRRPSLLVCSLLAMNLVMPFLAAGLARVLHLRPSIETALILLAVSPVPPILPNKETKAGGSISYGVSLLVVSALVAIVTVPFSVALIGRWFSLDLRVPPAGILIVVAKTVLVPTAVGMIVKAMAPRLAARLAKPLSILGMLMLVLGFVPVLVKMWPGMAAQATLPAVAAIVLLTLLGLAVGHWLGGPAREDRTVLALSTACRHPGVAIAVAGAIADAEQKPVLIAAVFLCVLVAAIVTIPYAKRRGRAAATADPSRA